MAATEPDALQGSNLVADLYRVHSEWLHAAVRRRGAGETTDDVVQETFLLVSKYPDATSLRHPKALLLKIAQNVVRSAARSARAAKHVQPVFDPMGPESVARPDQFETVLLKETILALPQIYRDIFLLARFDGMSYGQIADLRGISIKTVEWRMSRALAMCAARMRE